MAVRELPIEGDWSMFARIGSIHDEKARVEVWCPGELDGDPGERNVNVDVAEPLTPAEAERLADEIRHAAVHARAVAAWAVPLWEAAEPKRIAEAQREAAAIAAREQTKGVRD
jgi:hypothetical protein